MHSKSWREGSRVLLEFAVMAAGSLTFAVFVLGIALLLLTGNAPGGRDFVSYWVAGHRMLHHANPYDGAAVLTAERAVGFPAWAQALIMRNPPWALLLVLPLGWMSLWAGTLVWTMMLAGALAASVQMLWRVHGRPGNKLHWLAYGFAPALACLSAGQSSLFCLLGMVLFLRLQVARPFWAGAALWMCALKPQIFLPWGAVLLVWIVVLRRYRVLWGLAAALAASSLVAGWLDPGVWQQYTDMMRASGITGEYVACLSVALRFAVSPGAMGLQSLPAVVGCGWGIRYYVRHREEWDWKQHGALLLMVSVVVSPYAWLSDQSLLAPTLLLGMYRATREQMGVLVLASAVIEAQLLGGVTVHSAWLLWTGPMWVGWYGYVCGSSRARSAMGGAGAALYSSPTLSTARNAS